MPTVHVARVIVACLSCALLASVADAQVLRPAGELIAQLQSGGYVLAMRHARAPRAAPDASVASPGNPGLERELDDAGRASAAAMGEALRSLGIPIGDVLASPTFRAMQTVQQLAVGEPRAVAELGDGGRDMQPDAEGRRSAWMRERAARLPEAGTNTLLVTHAPNLVGAFGDAAESMADGETLVIDPRGGAPLVVGRVEIEEWPVLAGAGRRR